MTTAADRHTVNTITSDALDALYEALEAAQDTELYRQLRTADAAFASASIRAAQLGAQLAEARRLHAQTCPHAQGAVSAGFACSLCTALDARPADGAPPAEPEPHVYLSTGCLHGDHAYCQSMTGLNGAKRPASCKKCGAKCICPCHQAEEPTAHNDGPSTAECAEADRAWPLQKAGE